MQSVLSFDDIYTGIFTMFMCEHNVPVIRAIFSPSALDSNFVYAGIGIRAASKNIESGRHNEQNKAQNISIVWKAAREIYLRMGKFSGVGQLAG